MPYSIRTKDGLLIQDIPDDMAPDSQELKKKVAAIRASIGGSQQTDIRSRIGGSQQTEQVPDAKERVEEDATSPGILDKVKSAYKTVKNVITGEDRKTSEMEAIPSIDSLPELNRLSVDGLKSVLVTMTGNDDEVAQALKANFPGVEFRQDQKGNVIVKSSLDGKDYAINKPGLDTGDILKGALTALMFLPAGRAASIGGKMGISALTQSALEGAQSKSGGSFDVAPIALSAAAEIIPPALTKGKDTVKSGISKAKDFLKGKKSFSFADDIVAKAKEFITEEIPSEMGAAEIGETLSKAPVNAKNMVNSPEASAIALEIRPSDEIAQAAKNLGIQDYLQPDQISTSKAVKEMYAAVKRHPGSLLKEREARGLEKLADRANRLIGELGGTDDFSGLDVSIKGRMLGTVKDLESKAEELYSQIGKKIKADTPIESKNIIDFLKKKAEDFGGINKLSNEEKQIFRKLNPKKITTPESIDQINDGISGAKKIDAKTEVIQPTYALLDGVRKKLTQAKIRKTGEFKDMALGEIKALEKELYKDQYAAAKKFGADELFNTAQSTVKTRKELERDIVSIYGKKLDGSIVSPLTRGISNLPKGDVSDFVELTKRIPEEFRKKVVASGLNVALGKNVKEGTINFVNFSNWYDGLKKNKQAYTLVMSNLPSEAKKRLESLSTISKAINSTAKKNIDPGNMNIIDEKISANSLIGSVLSAVSRVTPSYPGKGAVSSVVDLIPIGGNKGLSKADKLLSSPEFINLVKRAGESSEESAIKRLSISKPFKDFYAGFKKTYSPSESERWIRNAMTGYRGLPEENKEEQ